MSVFLKKWLAGLTVLVIIIVFACSCGSANRSPVITSLEAERGVVFPLDCCQIECIASSSGGEELNYEWAAMGGTISGKGPKVVWIAPNEVGEYTVSVNVTAEEDNMASDSITITVKENQPPEVTGLRTSEDWVVPLGSCVITCEASDDGSGITYEWSASGGEIAGEGDTITWTAPEEEGSYTISVVVRDEMNAESSVSLLIKVGVNHAPVIVGDLQVSPGMKVSYGRKCTITCPAVDPDGDDLDYVWSTKRGSISAEGHIATWVAPNCAGTYDITVVVKDGRSGETTKAVQIIVGCG